jgi:hypothetical protein
LQYGLLIGAKTFGAVLVINTSHINEPSREAKKGNVLMYMEARTGGAVLVINKSRILSLQGKDLDVHGGKNWRWR